MNPATPPEHPHLSGSALPPPEAQPAMAAAGPGGIPPQVLMWAERPPLAAPVDYARITRPGHRWWRILVALLLLLGIWVVAQIVLAVGFLVVGVLAGWDPLWFMAGLMEFPAIRMTPGALLYTNLVLAAFIPATIISIRVAHGVRRGFVHSVAGRFRWGLFGQLTLLLLPIWLLYVVGATWAAGGSLASINPHPEMWALMAVVWLTTPLQSAGEEYAFRGWLLQNIGGFFAVRALAWGVPIIVSAVTFGLMHGSLDPWVLGPLMIMAAAAGVMAWRSGGLEAAIALHSLNNVIVMTLTLTMGGFDDAFISTETTGSPGDLAGAFLGHAAAVAVVWWWVKRRGVPNTTIVDPRRPLMVRGTPPPPGHPPAAPAPGYPPPAVNGSPQPPTTER